MARFFFIRNITREPIGSRVIKIQKKSIFFLDLKITTKKKQLKIKKFAISIKNRLNRFDKEKLIDLIKLERVLHLTLIFGLQKKFLICLLEKKLLLFLFFLTNGFLSKFFQILALINFNDIFSVCVILSFEIFLCLKKCAFTFWFCLKNWT